MKAMWLIAVAAAMACVAGCVSEESNPSADAMLGGAAGALEEVVCEPGERKYCNHQGTCNAAGTACVCDKPKHNDPAELCAMWHPFLLEPGQYCSPGDRTMCNHQGTCDATGQLCVCDNPINNKSEEHCAKWHPAGVPEGGVCMPGDRGYCFGRGDCDDTGMVCECDDPKHFKSEERCEIKHDVIVPEGLFCKPGDRYGCSLHGRCNKFGTACNCDNDWWQGPTCDTRLDQCPGYGLQPDFTFNRNPCSGNGTCIAPDTCECDPGYSGDNCEIDCIETLGGHEVCDGLDNNCNGEVDELCAPMQAPQSSLFRCNNSALGPIAATDSGLVHILARRTHTTVFSYNATGGQIARRRVQLRTPTIERAPNGDILIAGYRGAGVWVQRLDPTDLTVKTAIKTPSTYTASVAADADGAILIGDFSRRNIHRVLGGTTRTQRQHFGTTLAYSEVQLSSNTLNIAVQSRIVRSNATTLTPTGVIALQGTAEGLTLDSDGRIYVLEHRNTSPPDRIIRYDADGTGRTVLYQSTFILRDQIEYDPSDDSLIVGDWGANTHHGCSYRAIVRVPVN